MGIRIIKNSCLEDILERNDRQYLVGNLKFPQELEEIKDENIEVGISKYKEYKVCDAHFHTKCKEFEYIVEGKSKYLDLDTMKEYEVFKGDFFVIEPNTKYYQKVQPNTTILFFKYPGGNDKNIVILTDNEKKWGDEY